MLTETALRQLATATSYSRGEDYFYNGYVGRIKRTGNTFTGKVSGSDRYNVTLTVSPSGPDFACSCPYEFGGICKHAVAFGLAILEEFGPKIEPQEVNSMSDSSTVDAETLWQQTTTDQKLTFLRQLLAKQPDLRLQLAQFAGMKLPKPLAHNIVFFSPTDNQAQTESRIDTIRTEVYEELSDLAFDDDGLEFDQPGRRSDDYYSEESPDPNPLIEDVLRPYAEQTTQALREGRLTDALTVCLGIYEGTHSATEVETDDYGVIDDYPTQTWTVWNALMADAWRALSRQVLHPDVVSDALDQLAERIRFYDETDEEHDELYYDLRPFEPLLLALVSDMPSARAMQNAIERHDWQQRGTEYIQLQLADQLRDTELWLKTADQFAETDVAIGLRLVEHQRQSGDRAGMLQNLHRLDRRFPSQFDAFILNHLDDAQLEPGPDLNLYLKALENRCRQAGQLADYLKLRTHWSDSRRRTFADSLRPKANPEYMPYPLFYAQVLHTEGRTTDLLVWLKSLDWLRVRGLPDILALTAQTYPDECLTLTRDRATKQLETGKRDRTLYSILASWLFALCSIPSLKSDVLVVAAQYVARFPTLRALKAELDMKGLV